nr:PREDICTED: golgin subfamily A member 6-like protein 1 [Linepithema humile]
MDRKRKGMDEVISDREIDVEVVRGKRDATEANLDKIAAQVQQNCEEWQTVAKRKRQVKEKMTNLEDDLSEGITYDDNREEIIKEGMTYRFKRVERNKQLEEEPVKVTEHVSIDANKCLDILEKESEGNGITARIDARSTSCRGVITDWPEKIEELVEAITDDEKGDIFRLERMCRRKWDTKQKMFTNVATENIVITMKGSKLKGTVNVLLGREDKPAMVYDRYIEPERWPSLTKKKVTHREERVIRTKSKEKINEKETQEKQQYRTITREMNRQERKEDYKQRIAVRNNPGKENIETQVAKQVEGVTGGEKKRSVLERRELLIKTLIETLKTDKELRREVLRIEEEQGGSEDEGEEIGEQARGMRETREKRAREEEQIKRYRRMAREVKEEWRRNVQGGDSG